MMRTLFKYSFLLGVLGCAASGALAQSGDEYFHRAAQQFIGGNRQAALASLEKGLQVDPNNPKLAKLQAGLKQEDNNKPPKSKKGDDEENKNDKDKDKKDKDKAKGDKPPDPKEAKQDQTKQPPPNDGKEKDEKNEQGENAQPKPVAEMSKEQAEQILNSLKQDEKNMLRKYMMKRGTPTKHDKDW
jgi:hypothetical protein